jgi:hypothetical protein
LSYIFICKIIVMAKATKSSNASSSLRKVTKKRPGIHSTSKYSKLKSSKRYKKLNKGQGR